MREYRLAPLALDLGESRVRLALFEQHRTGSMRLRAVICRDVVEPELLSLVLEEMLREAGVRERRCVTALGVPEAALRVVRFPKMSWVERTRAARFEAHRFVTWDMDAESTLVRTHAFDASQNLYAVGAVRAKAVDDRIALLRAAGLTAHAIDHDAFALRRAVPDTDAIVDVGTERSSVHVFSESAPFSLHVAMGGAAITRGIAADLAIEFENAEHRKRIIGCGGAGTRAREQLVSAIAAAIDRARERVPVTRIALCGNGAKVPDLAQALESSTAAAIEMPVPDVLRSGAYPDDVVRAAASDWTLAAGLGIRSAA
jgi:Tfp pilus assembly PilM family ATPase